MGRRELRRGIEKIGVDRRQTLRLGFPVKVLGAPGMKSIPKTGARARQLGWRLAFHPSQYVILNSPDDSLVAKSAWDVSTQAEILDRMELGPEAVIVIHVGGAYGDRKAGGERWARTWKQLPRHAHARLVLENDDLRYGPADVLWIQERSGVRLIFDYQHW